MVFCVSCVPRSEHFSVVRHRVEGRNLGLWGQTDLDLKPGSTFY